MDHTKWQKRVPALRHEFTDVCSSYIISSGSLNSTIRKKKLCHNYKFFENKNKNYTANDRFHGNGPYGEILTKKQQTRTPGFTLPYNKSLLFTQICLVTKTSIENELVVKNRYVSNEVRDCNYFEPLS